MRHAILTGLGALALAPEDRGDGERTLNVPQDHYYGSDAPPPILHAPYIEQAVAGADTKLRALQIPEHVVEQVMTTLRAEAAAEIGKQLAAGRTPNAAYLRARMLMIQLDRPFTLAAPLLGVTVEYLRNVERQLRAGGAYHWDGTRQEPQSPYSSGYGSTDLPAGGSADGAGDSSGQAGPPAAQAGLPAGAIIMAAAVALGIAFVVSGKKKVQKPSAA